MPDTDCTPILRGGNKSAFCAKPKDRGVMRKITKIAIGAAMACGAAVAVAAPAAAQVSFGIGVGPGYGYVAPAPVAPAYSCYDAYGN